MTKRELIEAVASKSGLTQADAERALAGVVDAISESVAAGTSVTVPGFGTFEKRDRNARTGRNPQTGETMEIAATSVPAFKPATAFKRLVADA